jgi:hypothetical protein
MLLCRVITFVVTVCAAVRPCCAEKSPALPNDAPPFKPSPHMMHLTIQPSDLPVSRRSGRLPSPAHERALSKTKNPSSSTAVQLHPETPQIDNEPPPQGHPRDFSPIHIYGTEPAHQNQQQVQEGKSLKTSPKTSSPSNAPEQTV